MENQISNQPLEVVINAGSGAGDKDAVVRQLRELFAASNLKTNFAIAHGGEIVEFAQRAAQSAAQIVVAGGGDGTIAAVAAELVDTNKTLGVLPLGTLNHFSRDLNIPTDLVEAVQVIAAGFVKKIDVAEVNGRIFLNNSSIGLYPNIVRRREIQQLKLGRSKWYAALSATLAVVRQNRLFAVKIITDDEEITRLTPFVFVGNNEYEMDFFNLGKRKNLDAGKLSVYFLERTGRFGLARLAVRTIFGKIIDAKEFQALSVESMIIETRRRKKQILAATDGEARMTETPLHYKIRPQALRVIVPAPTQE